jgi:uncharacterized protein YdeI (YjbR/CyaY-like superfamily)
MKENLPVILFETEKNWIDWLEKNENEPGVWMRIAKKNSGIVSITYEQAVEVALCFGWIDGLKKKYDEKTWIQRFSPRKPTSQWSKINKEKALKLIETGKMQPSGLAAIEISKNKGTWDNAYDSQKNKKVPDELQAELDKNPEVAEFFNSLNSVNKYAIIYRLQVSRNPEIRAKKLTQFVEMLKRKEKIHNLNS